MKVPPTTTPPPPDLTAAELAAAVRFVARQTPHLALALVWSIVTNPQAVRTLREASQMVEPEHVAELAELDEVLRIAVESSGPARLRRSVAASDPAPQAWRGVDPEATLQRVVGRVRHVAENRPELLPALLARILGRATSRLAVRAYRMRGEEALALRALDKGVNVDIEDLLEPDDDQEDRPT